MQSFIFRYNGTGRFFIGDHCKFEEDSFYPYFAEDFYNKQTLTSVCEYA